jgi:hypothetical protein
MCASAQIGELRIHESGSATQGGRSANLADWAWSDEISGVHWYDNCVHIVREQDVCQPLTDTGRRGSSERGVLEHEFSTTARDR